MEYFNVTLSTIYEIYFLEKNRFLAFLDALNSLYVYIVFAFFYN